MSAMLEALARMGMVLRTHERIYAPDMARMTYGPCRVERVTIPGHEGGDWTTGFGWRVRSLMHLASGSWPGDPEVPVAFSFENDPRLRP